MSIRDLVGASMEIDEWFSWITKITKHLLWGAREEIINEGVEEGIDAAIDKRANKRAARRSRLLKIAAVLGVILGICVLGILNSPVLIELISGTGEAQAYEHRDAIVTCWVGLVFVLLVSPPVFHEITSSDFKSDASWSTRLFGVYALAGYVVFMLALLRFAYNRAWGTEAAQKGDIDIVLVVISSFFVVGPILDYFMYKRT